MRFRRKSFRGRTRVKRRTFKRRGAAGRRGAVRAQRIGYRW